MGGCAGCRAIIEEEGARLGALFGDVKAHSLRLLVFGSDIPSMEDDVLGRCCRGLSMQREVRT